MRKSWSEGVVSETLRMCLCAWSVCVVTVAYACWPAPAAHCCQQIHATLCLWQGRTWVDPAVQHYDVPGKPPGLCHGAPVRLAHLQDALQQDTTLTQYSASLLLCNQSEGAATDVYLVEDSGVCSYSCVSNRKRKNSLQTSVERPLP